jgi:hypothetical protein
MTDAKKVVILCGPTQYWTELSKAYKKQGMIWSSISLIIGLGLIIWGLSSHLNLTDTTNVTNTFQKYLIVGVATSIGFYLLSKGVKNINSLIGIRQKIKGVGYMNKTDIAMTLYVIVLITATFVSYKYGSTMIKKTGLFLPQAIIAGTINLSLGLLAL